MTQARQLPGIRRCLWHPKPSLRTSDRLLTIVRMRFRILALAVVALVFVGAHMSHIPLLAAANEIQMTAAQSMHHGMSGFVVGGSRSQASADVHTADAVNVSACCTDVVLGIPSRPALLAIAALLATALAIDDAVEFITYDERLATTAREYRLRVVQPVR